MGEWMTKHFEWTFHLSGISLLIYNLFLFITVITYAILLFGTFLNDKKFTLKCVAVFIIEIVLFFSIGFFI